MLLLPAPVWMEVPGSAAGFRAHWLWPLWEAGAVRCLAASADLPGLDVGAVIPASSRRLRAAARSRWSLAPTSTGGSGGARRGLRRYATVALARASWSCRWSVRGLGALMGLPSSSILADRERAVPVASWMPALAAPPTAHRQVKAAWFSAWASTTLGMSAVGVSPTCGVPGIDAACWVGSSHSRAMRPPTMAAGSLGALGLLWAWRAQAMSSTGSGAGRREIITAHPAPYQGQKSGGGGLEAGASASATPVTVWGLPGGVEIFLESCRPSEASQSPVMGCPRVTTPLEPGGAAISRGMSPVRCVFRAA